MDNAFYFPEFSLNQLVSWFSSVAIIFGGVVPYLPQYQEIKRTENTEGFSTYVCLALLIANTLRILFWFGKHFELPLLVQSIIMNITMLVLMHLCVKIRNQNQIVASKSRTFIDHKEHKSDENLRALNDRTLQRSHQLSESQPHAFIDMDWQFFWKWTDFLSYLEFLVSFSLLCGLLMYFFMESFFLVESIGFLAVFVEAMIGTPQFYRNFINKSTIGMSVKMVLMWTMGDMFKTGYFVIRNAPIQFWICGILQVLIDFSILLQVFLYRKSPRIKPAIF